MIILEAAQDPHASSPYTGVLVTFCLVAGGIFLVAGLIVSMLVDIRAQKAAAEAAGNAKKDPPASSGDAKVDAQAQGAVADTLKAVADFAGSLKDLTVGTRLAMVGVFLVAIGAVAAGADAIGDAGGDTSTPAGQSNPSDTSGN